MKEDLVVYKVFAISTKIYINIKKCNTNKSKEWKSGEPPE